MTLYILHVKEKRMNCVFLFIEILFILSIDETFFLEMQFDLDNKTNKQCIEAQSISSSSFQMKNA